MNNLRIYISCLGLSLAAILAVSSCDSGSNLLPYTIIEGKVLEYGTEEPIENAQVILYKMISSGPFSAGSIPMDTVITDASGDYSFQYEGHESYGVIAYHDTYFETSRVDYDNILLRKVNKKNIVLDPYALLELHIKNVNPFDGNDMLRYGVYAGSNLPNPPDLHGTNIDITEILPVKGNRRIRILWNSIKNYNSFVQEDSVYCKAHETTQYELLY